MGLSRIDPKLLKELISRLSDLEPSGSRIGKHITQLRKKGELYCLKQGHHLHEPVSTPNIHTSQKGKLRRSTFITDPSNRSGQLAIFFVVIVIVTLPWHCSSLHRTGSGDSVSPPRPSTKQCRHPTTAGLRSPCPGRHPTKIQSHMDVNVKIQVPQSNTLHFLAFSSYRQNLSIDSDIDLCTHL